MTGAFILFVGVCILIAGIAFEHDQRTRAQYHNQQRVTRRKSRRA